MIYLDISIVIKNLDEIIFKFYKLFTLTIIFFKEANFIIIIDGKSLSIHNLIKVARNNEKIELHSDSINRIVSCRNG